MAMLQHYNKDFSSAQDTIITFLYKHPGSTWTVVMISDMLMKSGYIIHDVSDVHIMLLDLRDKELIGINDELMIYYLD